MILITITHDQELRKKSSDYDEMFYSLLEKINRGLEKEEKATFNPKTKTLYISGAIKANDDKFLMLCENYKFFIQKSLL